MEIIDGKKISLSIQEEIKDIIIKNQFKITPKLVVIQVGDNSSSNLYIKNKKRVCKNVGVAFEHMKFDESISEERLIKEISKLNKNKKVTGLIVQLPLPKHIDPKKISNTISWKKDADGLTSDVLGMVMLNNSVVYPATPKGIITLLNKSKIELKGTDVTIVGRSDIVGKPLANMLINEGSTVTVCNSNTKDLEKKCSSADILILAMGKPNFITSKFVKKGSIIVDVGTTIVDGKLLGDVHFDDVKKKVSMITPVPGGVGPMTIASLVQNVLELHKNYSK